MKAPSSPWHSQQTICQPSVPLHCYSLIKANLTTDYILTEPGPCQVLGYKAKGDTSLFSSSESVTAQCLSSFAPGIPSVSSTENLPLKSQFKNTSYVKLVSPEGTAHPGPFQHCTSHTISDSCFTLLSSIAVCIYW